MLIALTCLYLVTALPFFFAGISLTVLFGRYHSDFSRLYFYDLIGAGCGCLLIILLLKLCANHKTSSTAIEKRV